ncbi:ATP-dependent DNA helicase 2 subunit ku80 [Striga asiatica]|uniref:ATP-dependent DNA helicase 2 subunit ku80 n=1 Tax=Striga asiatica TaxID=4170 RepID=A0A5A7R354_STRAF|nr:ATP-dependent DNA helicase 2 subunit ku80 [Striga asiatica]
MVTLPDFDEYLFRTLPAGFVNPVGHRYLIKASHRPRNFTAFGRPQARRTFTAFSSSSHLLRAIHSLLTASLSDLLRATVVRRPPAVIRRPPLSVDRRLPFFDEVLVRSSYTSLRLHLVSSPRNLCDTGDFELSPNMKIKVDYEYKYIDDPGRVTPAEQWIRGYWYGPQVIPISSAELDAVKFKPENGLKLLGFMEASNVMSWIHSISKYFLLRRMWEFQFPSLSNLPSTMQPTEQQQEVADKLVQMLDLAPPGREEALQPNVTPNPVPEQFPMLKIISLDIIHSLEEALSIDEPYSDEDIENIKMRWTKYFLEVTS